MYTLIFFSFTLLPSLAVTNRLLRKTSSSQLESSD